MAFEKGNQHGAKPRLFDAALRRAILADDGARVRACCEKLLDEAANGEAWAINLLADRLDGKAAQAVTLSGDPDAPIVTRLERLIVNPSNAG